MAKSMFIVIFALSFAWQWTDVFYSNLLYGDVKLLPSLVKSKQSIEWADAEYYLNYVRSSTGDIFAF